MKKKQDDIIEILLRARKGENVYDLLQEMKCIIERERAKEANIYIYILSIAISIVLLLAGWLYIS